MNDSKIIENPQLPPLSVEIDDIGEDINIQRAEAHIATVHNFYFFPCIDEDEPGNSVEEVDAEAKRMAYLFAASEDLLAVCEFSLPHICSYLCPVIWKAGEIPKHHEFCKLARAAVAKAKGEL